MARKISLREFQQNVAQRIRDLGSQKSVVSKLGFQIGAENWLVNLADVSEVIPVPTTVGVPLTLPWFRGVANVRGKLYSVADFAAFQGGAAITPGAERRVILIADRLLEGSGLMVSRMLGLRSPDQFSTEPTVPGSTGTAQPWVKARYRDHAGVIWQELDVAALVGELSFLEVGTPIGDMSGATAVALPNPVGRSNASPPANHNSNGEGTWH